MPLLTLVSVTALPEPFTLVHTRDGATRCGRFWQNGPRDRDAWNTTLLACEHDCAGSDSTLTIARETLLSAASRAACETGAGV